MDSSMPHGKPTSEPDAANGGDQYHHDTGADDVNIDGPGGGEDGRSNEYKKVEKLDDEIDEEEMSRLFEQLSPEEKASYEAAILSQAQCDEAINVSADLAKADYMAAMGMYKDTHFDDSNEINENGSSSNSDDNSKGARKLTVCGNIPECLSPSSIAPSAQQQDLVDDVAWDDDDDDDDDYDDDDDDCEDQEKVEKDFADID